MPNYSRSGLRTDRRLVAAYLDGLLDANAAARVGSLLESDPAWAAELARQKRVRDLLATATAPAPDTAAAGVRVWRRVAASAAYAPREPFWRRPLVVPFPLALGTAALVLVLGFGLVYTAARGSVGTVRITTVPSGLKQVQIQAPLADLQQLLRSLESDASGREVIISLPDASQRFFVGEPVFLRAAEVDRSRFR